MNRTPAALQLHRGGTVHKRFAPFRSSFRYRLAMIDIDIDRMQEADQQCSLFGIEKTRLFSFRRRDHGALEAADLRPWAETEFRQAGIDPTGTTIRLITFPRHAFFKFAPISLWISFRSDRPVAILYEVRNTFGERHTYAAPLEGSWSRHMAPKSFHVSPFFDVSGQYAFSLRHDGSEMHLGVTTLEGNQPVHTATLVTRIAPASDAHFAKIAAGMPFSTLGVTLGIHWEALKLWAKGARYRPKPGSPEPGPTYACPAAKDR